MCRATADVDAQTQTQLDIYTETDTNTRRHSLHTEALITYLLSPAQTTHDWTTSKSMFKPHNSMLQQSIQLGLCRVLELLIKSLSFIFGLKYLKISKKISCLKSSEFPLPTHFLVW